VLSRNTDRTATIELEIADRAAADALVGQYGVFADGDRLRLSIKTGGGGQQGQQRNGGGGRAPAPTSGEWWGVTIRAPLTTTAASSTLTAWTSARQLWLERLRLQAGRSRRLSRR
jgi:hypothetical protein